MVFQDTALNGASVDHTWYVCSFTV